MQTFQASIPSSIAVLPKLTEAQRDAELLLKSFGTGKQVATEVLCEDLDKGTHLDSNDRDTIVYFAVKELLELTFREYSKANGEGINQLIHTWDTALSVLKEWCGDNDKVREYGPIKHAFERGITSAKEISVLEQLFRGLGISKQIYEPRELGFQILNDVKGKLPHADELCMRPHRERDLDKMLLSSLYQGQAQARTFVVSELSASDLTSDQKALIIFDAFRKLASDTTIVKGAPPSSVLRAWDSAISLVELLRVRNDIVPNIGNIVATALRVSINSEPEKLCALEATMRKLGNSKFKLFGSGMLSLLRQEMKMAA